MPADCVCYNRCVSGFKIALALEVAGFFFASVSILILNIGPIRDWADRAKDDIIQRAKATDNPPFLWWNSRDEIRNLRGVLSTIFIDPLVLLWDVLQLQWGRLGLVFERRPLPRKGLQELADIRAGNVRLQRGVIRSGWELIITLSQFYPTVFVFFLSTKLAKRFSGDKAVTRFVAGLGTLLVFAGLVWELVVTP